KNQTMSKRILVCDDDKAIAEMIKIMLENEGYEVRLMSSGKAIKKKVLEYQPQLILIDIWMPGIGGKEAIGLLKKDPETKNIPLFIISALHESEINQIVKKVGADGCLPKPFNISDLLAIIEKHT